MITRYGCRSEAGNQSHHCQDYGLKQCDYCRWYEQGNGLPHYQLPAVAIVGEWLPMYGGHWRTFDKNQPHTSRLWIDDWGLGPNSLFVG